MISNRGDYAKAEEELRLLGARLQQLKQMSPIGSKGLVKAGIRKMIARLHEELALFDGSKEARSSDPK